jgi:DNA-binding GntR family transcriptional regulator
MTVVRARGLALQVHEEMRRRIAAGEFPPGTAVVIADIAKQLGVSATPVREAFSRLAAEGQLRFVDNFGYSVPALPVAKDYVDWAIARVVVEANALLYIMDPPDKAALDEAEDINAQIRSTFFGTDHEGIRRYSDLNWRFHTQLIRLAGNTLLDDVHQRLYAAPQFSRIFLGRGIPNQTRIAAEHDMVLKQLRLGDRAGAAEALRHHIVDSLQRDARMSDVSVSLKLLIRQQVPKPQSVQNRRRKA